MSNPAPTLNELNEFVIKNPTLFQNDEKKAIESYFINTQNNYSDGKYYLKGQLKIGLHEEITTEKIKTAIEMDNESIKTYGGPCNSFELMSMEKQNFQFENLQKVLQKYLTK